MPASPRFTIRVASVVASATAVVLVLLSGAAAHTVIIVGRVCRCGEVDGTKNETQHGQRRMRSSSWIVSQMFYASLFGLLLRDGGWEADWEFGAEVFHTACRPGSVAPGSRSERQKEAPGVPGLELRR